MNVSELLCENLHAIDSDQTREHEMPKLGSRGCSTIVRLLACCLTLSASSVLAGPLYPAGIAVLANLSLSGAMLLPGGLVVLFAVAVAVKNSLD